MYCLSIIYWVISIITSGAIFGLCGWYNEWYLYIVTLIMIPVLYVVCFGINVVILYIWSLFLNKKKDVTKPNLFYYWWVRQICHQLDVLSRTKVVINGQEKLPLEKYLLVSNHISMFDAIVVVDKIKSQPILGITKIENEKIPICGPFIHEAGFIALDRSNARKAVSAIKKANSYIENNWCNMFVYPEGTRSKDGSLLEFHAGSFNIAYRVNAPVVVCNFVGTDKISKNFPFKSTKVTLDIIKVIYPNEYQDLNTQGLADMARNIILEFQNKEK